MKLNDINWSEVPSIITKEQMRLICHCSKRTALYYLKTGLILFIISILACRPGLYQRFRRLIQQKPAGALLINLILLALSVAYMVYNSYTPFLYAKF